ncbi:sulfite reductase flavoprotein subunit alpha [Paraburkholderia sp. MMS20-SJTR3]|uniref:NADPH--hemoprotein reductase n=1 Tax=Paraburkholderia sejongensis TaxID=2886946 RepID=A0ABS8JMF3_9BURK|nr:sulfite reductase flavoprotein subunit alpha [Paraburkholderia sp. MMS20-SJTR3]MCC8391082.1 sulfite reductase flavoprotein subunit alpha [Paraburkholderia sp. MMS20-SJTR3]
MLEPARLAWLLAAAGALLAWASPVRAGSAAGVGFAYLCACAAIVAAHRARGQAALATGTDTPEQEQDDVILVAYASQTGSAEQLATQTRRVLEAAGTRVRLAPLGLLKSDDLLAHARALFVVSTTGEGEPPDHAAPFVRRAMQAEPHDSHATQLATLRYAVLALGDRAYANYCAFGHRVAGWLNHRGAQPLFDTIEVDNGDALALRRWQTQLSTLVGSDVDTAWMPLNDSIWTLDQRELLNPGSAGAPAYHIGLSPRDAATLDWQAGDIAEIQPRQPAHRVQRWLARHGLDGAAPVHCEGRAMRFEQALATRQLPSEDDDRNDDRNDHRGLSPQDWIDTLAPHARRSYSIASLPADGRLELLIRQARAGDASAAGGYRLGLASGWLTAHAEPGDEITLRVRTNRAFHAPRDARPLILIGNGTGLAGLRAHLKQRARDGQRRNWLIFGERSAAHDFFYRDEIAAWQRDRVLERTDLAWSRDGGELRYVQHALSAAADALREWLDAGAAIYVCGSLDGMAPDVHRALLAIVGQQRLDELISAGRYRRDVY